jgi:hypothetical protein
VEHRRRDESQSPRQSNVSRCIRALRAPATSPRRLWRDGYALQFETVADFKTLIGTVQTRVCHDKVMPHGKRPNQILEEPAPNMASFWKSTAKQRRVGNRIPFCNAASSIRQSDVQSFFEGTVFPVLHAELRQFRMPQYRRQRPVQRHQFRRCLYIADHAARHGWRITSRRMISSGASCIKNCSIIRRPRCL